MKSSVAQLKNRGHITLEDLRDYKDLSKTELLELIKSKESYTRTIAVRLLSDPNDLDDNIIYLFLHTLTQEKKLYTKIELCNALQKGGIKSAKIMVNYLGQIGNNQYKQLPNDVFNKKSYPLPRDIIARTLAHMNEDILPELLKILQTNNILAIREVIDAIGFICFYSLRSCNNHVLDALLLCLKENFNDDIIRWKLVRAFESFNSTAVIDILTDIMGHDSQPIIRGEARRSLVIINTRIKTL